MLEDNLEKLGFTPNLVKIYLSLLSLGKTRAGEIIKDSGLQRSVVYTGLDELIRRGLVTKTIMKGVAVYRANDPEALVHESDERRKLAEAVASDLKEKQSVSDREVLIYEGEDTVKRIADKSLNTKSGGTVYFMGSSKVGSQSNLEQFWRSYHKKRIEKQISCKILYDKSAPESILEHRNMLPFCEARYLPFGTEMPMWFNLFNDTVAMLIPEKDSPLAFLIKNPATHIALVNYFDYLWSQSKPFIK